MMEMRWLNLRDGACPKCNTVLVETQTKYLVACPAKQCGFKISKKRVKEIIENMSKTRKWGQEFSNEYEENLSALNNL